MTTSERFSEAAKILYSGNYCCKTKAPMSFYFDAARYEVVVGDRGVSCSCPHGSHWGMKERGLPCKHILAVIGAMIGMSGAILRKRWEDPVLMIKDLYSELSAPEKRDVKEWMEFKDKVDKK